MKVIGLGHYSRTGKDSLANALIASLKEYDPSLKVAKIPFAWKLKQISHDLYGWAGMREPEFYETSEGEKYRDIILPAIGKTPVQIWVDLGTPAVREKVYQETWVDYLLKTERDLDVLIVPDVRFPNEIQAMESVGAILAKVVRPGYGPRKTVADRALLGYAGWHYVIGESGRMGELREWANRFAWWLTGGVKPVQTDEERASALAVEAVEPWEPPSEVSYPTITIDPYLARGILNSFYVAFDEGLGPDPEADASTYKFIRQILTAFPDLKEEFYLVTYFTER